MILMDRHGLITALNREAEEFFGWTEAELLGEPITRFIPPRFHWLLGSILPGADVALIAGAKGGTVSCFAWRRNGSEFPVELSRRPIGESADAQSLVTMRDLTLWRRAQEVRSKNNERARATLESIGDAVITTDAAGKVTYLNPVAEHLTGWLGSEALGQSLDAVLPLLSEASRLPVPNTAVRCLEEGRSIDLESGVLLLRRDGTEVAIGDSAAPLRDRTGDTIGVVMVIQDESEKRRVGHRLSYEASHDGLTGLINRREFERRLTQAVGEQHNPDTGHVLLCLDLDGFKAVNDASGHDAGDELLRSLGPIFSRHLRKCDTLARLGGDEFGVLLEDCPMLEAERIAESLRAAVEAHRFERVGRRHVVGVSIGIAPVTIGAQGIAGVLRAADRACYAAKEMGGNRVHSNRAVAPSSDEPQFAERRILRLTQALEENRFQLYAQPIVSLQPARSSRARLEVLLRLPNSHGQMQVAADFLPQAERYNLMPAIDQWVIHETLSLLGAWRRERPAEELPVCAINLSASALSDATLLHSLERQLDEHGVPADALCFEIAERAALVDLAQTVRFLTSLRRTGCSMALEDLGSGVTSLTYLRTLPVDFLKIGGQFVGDLVSDPMCGCIVKAVHEIGECMGISTIAKQVGAEPIVGKLRAMGIGYAQGRALTAPMPLRSWDGGAGMPRALSVM